MKKNQSKVNHHQRLHNFPPAPTESMYMRAPASPNTPEDTRMSPPRTVHTDQGHALGPPTHRMCNCQRTRWTPHTPRKTCKWHHWSHPPRTHHHRTHHPRLHHPRLHHPRLHRHRLHRHRLHRPRGHHRRVGSRPPCIACTVKCARTGTRKTGDSLMEPGTSTRVSVPPAH